MEDAHCTILLKSLTSFLDYNKFVHCFVFYCYRHIAKGKQVLSASQDEEANEKILRKITEEVRF